MVELTGDGRAVIAALLAARVAWQSPDELAVASGLGVEATNDLLAGLDVDGWIAAWDRPDGVFVTLSVAGADRLDVRLVEFGPDETPRWARRSDPEPPAPRALGVFREGRVASLELVVDDRPMPEFEVEFEAPELPTEGGGAAEQLPKPTIFVGSGLSPWPGPGDGRKASCPACRSRRLRATMYCICCDRWGLDHLTRGEPAARPIARRDPVWDVRRADLERRARKEKRRHRRADQAEAEKVRRRGRRRSALL